MARIVPIRNETHASYENNSLDNFGRLLKNEAELEEMLYLKIEKELFNAVLYSLFIFLCPSALSHF